MTGALYHTDGVNTVEPGTSVVAPELQSFGDVPGRRLLGALEIRDRAGDPQHAVVGPGAQ